MDRISVLLIGLGIILSFSLYSTCHSRQRCDVMKGEFYHVADPFNAEVAEVLDVKSTPEPRAWVLYKSQTKGGSGLPKWVGGNSIPCIGYDSFKSRYPYKVNKPEWWVE